MSEIVVLRPQSSATQGKTNKDATTTEMTTSSSSSVGTEKNTDGSSKDASSSTSTVKPSMFHITRHKIHLSIQTILFLDTCEITHNNYFKHVYPGSTYTTRRVRAARSILCNQAAIFDTTTSSHICLTYVPSIRRDMVRLLLRHLNFGEVIDTASLNYRAILPEMRWIKEQGIKEFCKWFGKEDCIGKLLPGILLWSGKERKRTLNQIMENGEGEYPVAKRTRTQSPQPERRESEKSPDKENVDSSVAPQESRKSLSPASEPISASSKTTSASFSTPQKDPEIEKKSTQIPLDTSTEIDGTYIL